MKAVVMHEYGGPEKLKFEDNIPDPQIGGDTASYAKPLFCMRVCRFHRIISCSTEPTRTTRSYEWAWLGPAPRNRQSFDSRPERRHEIQRRWGRESS